MARTKAGLGEGARLADYLSMSVLGCVFPTQRVHEALDAHDCNTRRIRRFPAVAGVKVRVRSCLLPTPRIKSLGSA